MEDGADNETMPDLIKLKLTIAYEGTRYAGWQVQKTGLGVQQVLEEAVAKLFPGASRLLWAGWLQRLAFTRGLQNVLVALVSRSEWVWRIAFAVTR